MARKINVLCILCWLVYFTSYLTRFNYGAVISDIVISQGFLKSQAGAVTTAGFVTYGLGQIISGLLGDRLDSKNLVFGGMLATSLMNILLPLCSNVYLMAAVWCVNGFAQSMMWPPLVKTMTMYLDEERFKKTCVNVSMASAAGTVAVYFLAPVCISLSGWKLLFFVCAAAGILTAFIWKVGLQKIGDPPADFVQSESNKGKGVLNLKVIASSGLLLIILAIIPQGVLRDGITTWLPSLLTETFHLGSAAAILTTVAIPLFSIFSMKLSAQLHQRVWTNEVTCAAVLFGAGLLGCVILGEFFRAGAWLSVSLCALITGCMHGINLMLISMVPARFKQFGAVATVSGFLNAFSYVGSASSSYGFAKLSETFGWQFTLMSWAVLALAGTVCCFAAVRKWRDFIKEGRECISMNN